MRKCFVTAAILAICLVQVRADLTLTQTMTMEGPAAAMMAPGQLPKIIMRIKGMKARSDIEVMGQTITAITDLNSNQVIVLHAQTKTAQVVSAESIAAGKAPIVTPDIDVSLKPTGKSQTIDGMACDEHAFAMTMSLAEFSGQAPMPPDAAAMMKDIRIAMNGTSWIAKTAPGADEYMTFNKAALQSNLLGALAGMKPGQSGGLDRLMAAAASAPGVPYLTEITLTFEGSGPMVDAMKQTGPIKMIQKTSSLSTEPLSDELFKVPQGYTIQK